MIEQAAFHRCRIYGRDHVVIFLPDCCCRIYITGPLVMVSSVVVFVVVVDDDNDVMTLLLLIP